MPVPPSWLTFTCMYSRDHPATTEAQLILFSLRPTLFTQPVFTVVLSTWFSVILLRAWDTVPRTSTSEKGVSHDKSRRLECLLCLALY